MKENKKALCPECDEFTIPEIIEKEEKVIIRKEEFKVKVKRAICTNCHAEFGLSEYGFDEKQIAYDLYRKKHNYLFPDDIKRIREKYGLRQKPFSRLLGFGEITIHLYEKGALPDETHMEMLKLAENPENIKKIYEDNKEAISDSDRQIFENNLQKLLDEKKKNKLREIIIALFDYEPDIYSGYKKFNLDYFTNFIKLLLKFKSPLYKTHLVKICCYLDFLKFKNDGCSFTGCRYVVGPYGPFLDQYDKLFCYLKDRNAVETVIDFKNNAEYFNFTEEPDISLFSEKDMKLIREVTEKLGNLTPGELSNKTHKEFPDWNEKIIGQYISFEDAKYLKL
ncbi:MAG: DUF4065 domain-containing protein [Candidatus Goldbacteria bacterium]|nr:DUF4065 domain-containing protein [Candidatus Goldiibacteriota bacterium]